MSESQWPEIMDCSTAADYVGCKKWTMYRLMKRGKLKDFVIKTEKPDPYGGRMITNFSIRKKDLDREFNVSPRT